MRTLRQSRRHDNTAAERSHENTAAEPRLVMFCGRAAALRMIICYQPMIEAVALFHDALHSPIDCCDSSALSDILLPMCCR